MTANDNVDWDNPEHPILRVKLQDNVSIAITHMIGWIQTRCKDCPEELWEEVKLVAAWQGRECGAEWDMKILEAAHRMRLVPDQPQKEEDE